VRFAFLAGDIPGGTEKLGESTADVGIGAGMLYPRAVDVKTAEDAIMRALNSPLEERVPGKQRRPKPLRQRLRESPVRPPLQFADTAEFF